MMTWILQFAFLMSSENPCRVTSMHLIWCVQHVSATSWVTEELAEAAKYGVVVRILVTQERNQGGQEADQNDSPKSDTAGSSNPATEANNSCPGTNADRHGTTKVSYGSRPVLRQLLGDIITGPSTTVMACCPESLKIDVSNTTAVLQSRIIQGCAKEIALHTESFG